MPGAKEMDWLADPHRGPAASWSENAVRKMHA